MTSEAVGVTDITNSTPVRVRGRLDVTTDERLCLQTNVSRDTVLSHPQESARDSRATDTECLLRPQSERVVAAEAEARSMRRARRRPNQRPRDEGPR